MTTRFVGAFALVLAVLGVDPRAARGGGA